MASKKITLFFKDADGFGWSETYYNTQTNQSQLVGTVSALVIARMGLSTTNVVCHHVRIQTDTKRLVTVIAPQNGAGQPGSQPIPTDAPEVAIKCNVVSANIGFNRKLIRGVPDRIVQDNSFFPDSSYITAMNTFRTVLLNQNFVITGRVGTAGPSTPAHAFQTNSPRGFIFQAVTSLAVAGNTVRITGANVPGFNGLKQVISVSNGTMPGESTFVVGGFAPPVVPTNTATVVKMGAIEGPVTDVQFTGVSRRGAGSPFGRSRGRKQTLYPGRH